MAVFLLAEKLNHLGKNVKDLVLSKLALEAIFCIFYHRFIQKLKPQEGASMKLNVKYIVIGARGYIGSKLMSSIPNEIIGLGTASCPSENLFNLRLDIREDFVNLPINDGDVVFLTAAISAPDICRRERDRARAVNVAGTTELIEHVIARGGRVVFFSSDTVYGERPDDFEDGSHSNPAGEYAEMKYEVEQRFVGNPSFKAIRLSYVFSREDKFSTYLVDCERLMKEADLFHPFFRAIVHRDDVVAGALALAESWEEVSEQVINFGGPQTLSRIDFAESLRNASLHGLKFKVTEPGVDFFKNRPRIISMKSPVFSRLLGRPPRNLYEAACLEFA